MQSNPQNIQMQEVRGNVDKTTKEMQKNLTLLHQREEAITSLDQKSSTLHGTSQAFQNESTRLKEQQYWKQLRSVCLVLFIIYEFTLFFIFRENFVPGTFYAIIIGGFVGAVSWLWARFRHLKSLGALAVPLYEAV